MDISKGGAFEQWFDESWTSGLAQDTLNRAVRKNTNAMHSIWKLPLQEYSLYDLPPFLKVELALSVLPIVSIWLAHPSYDDYWKRWTIEDHYSEMAYPPDYRGLVRHFSRGSLRNYIRGKSAQRN